MWMCLCTHTHTYICTWYLWIWKRECVHLQIDKSLDVKRNKQFILLCTGDSSIITKNVVHTTLEVNSLVYFKIYGVKRKELIVSSNEIGKNPNKKAQQIL
mgnify:FL=1